MTGQAGRMIAGEPKARSNEDTVEIVLTAAEQLELQRIAVSGSGMRMTGTFMQPHDTYICRRSARIDTVATLCFSVVVLGITIAIGWHGLAAEPSVGTLSPVASTAAAPQTPASPHAAVIQVANPFDAAEVFELPAAISGANVQAAIADILMERARERIRLGIVPHRMRGHHQQASAAADSQRDVVVTRLFGPNIIAAVPPAAPTSTE